MTSGSWTLEQRRITLAYLANGAHFSDGLSEQLIFLLDEKAADAVCIFLGTSKIFDDMYRMTPDVEFLVINAEMSG